MIFLAPQHLLFLFLHSSHRAESLLVSVTFWTLERLSFFPYLSSVWNVRCPVNIGKGTGVDAILFLFDTEKEGIPLAAAGWLLFPAGHSRWLCPATISIDTPKT
jgi:hypothetical protein